MLFCLFYSLKNYIKWKLQLFKMWVALLISAGLLKCFRLSQSLCVLWKSTSCRCLSYYSNDLHTLTHSDRFKCLWVHLLWKKLCLSKAAFLLSCRCNFFGYSCAILKKLLLVTLEQTTQKLHPSATQMSFPWHFKFRVISLTWVRLKNWAQQNKNLVYMCWSVKVSNCLYQQWGWQFLKKNPSKVSQEGANQGKEIRNKPWRELW